MKTIKIASNAWADLIAFIGTERVDSFGCEFDAKDWLSKMLATGEYKLSTKSNISAEEVKAHEEAINNVKVR